MNTLAAILIVALALVAPAASAETPTGRDISERIDQIGSDIELVVERDVVARMAELHFMSASLSIVPEEEVPATERETQRAAIEVADNCAAQFTKLVAIVGKKGETRAWLAAMPCFSRDGAGKSLGQAKTHSQQRIDTSDYPKIFGDLSAGLKKVLVGYE